MIDTLQREHFESLPRGSIVIDSAGQRFAFDVIEVRDLPPHSVRERPFAVLLAGPASPVLAQGVRPLHHPTLGDLHLFMVPVGRRADGVLYELVFN